MALTEGYIDPDGVHVREPTACLSEGLSDDHRLRALEDEEEVIRMANDTLYA
jgi:hypothetical protein